VAVLPRVGVGNQLPIMLHGSPGPNSAVLFASLASMIVDFSVRQKSASHLNYFVMKQAPVLSPPAPGEKTPWGELLLDFVVSRVAELTVTDNELAPFAEDLGHAGGPFRWDVDRRVVLQAELDALFFHLYGLGREDVDWVLDSFTVLRKYEERDHGEFRTKRMVLERYDAMTVAIETGSYECPLDVPPADDAIRHGG
jgi:hypothetical protein